MAAPLFCLLAGWALSTLVADIVTRRSETAVDGKAA
jgi:hypothetical protein